MRSKITTVAIALALVGAFAAPASAAPTAPTVIGVVAYHGTPKAGIRVGWFSPSDQSYASVVSAADGSYSLPLPAAGSDYVLYSNLEMKKLKQSRVSKGYVGVFYGEDDTRDFAVQTLEPYEAGTASDEVDIQLAKPGSLLGLGDAFMDQYVYLTTLGGTVVRGTEGEEERVYFSNLVPGDYQIKVANETGDATALEQVFTVTDGQITEFSLDSLASGRVSGVVTGSGKKLEGVLVTAVPFGETDETDETETLYAQTNSQGRYTFAGLRKSSYTLTFGSNGSIGLKGWVQESTVVTGVNNDTTVQSNATLAVGGRIRATVLKSASSRHNTFTLVRPDGITIDHEPWNASETQNFGNLASGKYTLYFTNSRSDRYGKATVTVKAGKTTDIGTFSRTKDGVTIVGSINGLGSGATTKNIRVDASAPGLPPYSDMELNGKGGYKLAGVVPGTYTLEVGAPGREVGFREFTAKQRASNNAGIVAGPKVGKVHATLNVNGRPIGYGYLGFRGDSDDTILGEFVKGVFHGTGAAGTYDEVSDFWYGDPFQANSPYWLALPKGTLPITLTSGATNKLGTLELDVLPAVQPAE